MLGATMTDVIVAEHGVCQEEEEAVHDAFADVRATACVEGAKATFDAIYLHEGVDEGGVFGVGIAGGARRFLGALQLPLDLQARGDQLQGI